jgi:hypothetical protein
VKLAQESADKLALQKEVLGLTLVRDEAEAAVKALREQLADARRALAREVAEHQATSAVLSDLRASLEAREQQLAEARQLLDSMSAELGILASRLHRLQQERDGLRSARQAERLARRLELLGAAPQHPQAALPQSPQLQLLHAQLQELDVARAAAAGGAAGGMQDIQQLTGAAAAAAQLQLLSLQSGQQGYAGSSTPASTAAPAAAPAPASLVGDDVSTADSQSYVDCLGTSQEGAAAQQSLQQQVQQPERSTGAQGGSGSSAARPSGSASRGSSPSAAAEGDASAYGAPLAADPGEQLSGDNESLLLCAHGQLDAACLLCMCQRFLEATAGSCSHLPAGGGGSAAPDAAAAAAAAAAGGPSPLCAPEAAAAQYRQYLSISELARNRLEAENAALTQQVEALQGTVGQQARELRALQAHPAALLGCSIQELTELEASLEASTKAVRQVVLQRSIAEYRAQASAESLRCAVCMEERRSLAFSCGHQTCDRCGEQMKACPFCRQTITAKIRLYE